MISTAVPRPTSLVDAVLPRAGWLVDAVVVVAGVALIAISAQISIRVPGTPVPITGQTFAVVLVGSALGMTRGIASLVLYVLLGAVGLPFYAAGAHGWDQVSGSTGGYLIGFVLAAALTGALADRGWDRRFGTAVTSMLTGNVLIYLCGLPWLAHATGAGLEQTLEWGLYPFVPGDVVKLYLAAALLPAAWRVVPRDRRA